MSMVLIGHDFPEACTECACCHDNCFYKYDAKKLIEVSISTINEAPTVIEAEDGE